MNDSPVTLLEVLRAEKAPKLPGDIYHKVQVELTYNSNRMEGSRLTTGRPGIFLKLILSA